MEGYFSYTNNANMSIWEFIWQIVLIYFRFKAKLQLSGQNKYKMICQKQLHLCKQVKEEKSETQGVKVTCQRSSKTITRHSTYCQGPRVAFWPLLKQKETSFGNRIASQSPNASGLLWSLSNVLGGTKYSGCILEWVANKQRMLERKNVEPPTLKQPLMVCGLAKNNNGWKHNLNFSFLYGFKLCCAVTKTFNKIQSKRLKFYCSGRIGWLYIPGKPVRNKLAFIKPTLIHFTPSLPHYRKLS